MELVVNRSILLCVFITSCVACIVTANSLKWAGSSSDDTQRFGHLRAKRQTADLVYVGTTLVRSKLPYFASESSSREKRAANLADECSAAHDGEEQKDEDLKALLEKAKSSFPMVNESSFSMSLTWAGNGVILAYTTSERNLHKPDPPKIYRSEDNGRTLKVVDSFNGLSINTYLGFQKRITDTEGVIFVAEQKPNDHGSTLFISSNSGKTFTTVPVPFLLQEPLIFHHSKPDWLLAKSADALRQIWLSQNFGSTWTCINEYTTDVKWGRQCCDSNETIFIMTDQMGSEYTNTTLYRSTDLGETSKVLLDRVHGLAVEGKFMYASILDQHGSQDRALVVSTDGGDTWDEAQVPAIRPEQFFTILDGSEGMVFLHVDELGTSGKGTLYTSGCSGLVFSESLRNHLYTKSDSITDFHKVKSMTGVYLASQIMPDSGVRTMITYNRGGSWQQIDQPHKGVCSSAKTACNLHIHGPFSMSRNIVVPSPPLSVESAPGLIIAHGNLGATLETDDPDVFVSRDGSYSWFKSLCNLGATLETDDPDVFVSRDGGYSWFKSLSGPHHFAIADYGSIIVAVPHNVSGNADTLKFSIDGGMEWHCYEFTNETVHFTGLLTEPGSRSLFVNLWGYDVVSGDWQITTIDFKAVLKTECKRLGYRKIAGDRCEGGWQPKSLFVDLNKTCNDEEKFVAAPSNHVATNDSSAMNDAIVAMIVIVVVCLSLCMVIVFIKKLQQIKSSTARYRYARLSQGEQVAVDFGSDDEQTSLMSTSCAEPFRDADAEDTTAEAKASGGGGDIAGPARLPASYHKTSDESDDDLLLSVN
ncbi:PREDICTED: sortilin-like [Priapulus caudatus]|uniref:Sortilin-like n=1 Tax=Priapulus caudatus TaxID=37621 RepID=A0ABM1ECX5_PRICU|nr:PREDICTED: sortilin-like [Priapulus caudatus]